MQRGEKLSGGRYEILGVLGEGAQATTYDAIDLREGRPVAIKRFDVRGAKGWKDVELAEREARVLATLDHPLVVRYLGHFEEDGALYLVMEKVEGETLEAMRQRLGALPEDEVRRFLACADRAMTYLHGRSSAVVHRDVKPRNVIRRPDGSYVFVDFGAVSDLVTRGRGSTLVGTYGYMAPEQLQGRAMPATDVYAIGATALAALAGVEPETLPHHGLRVDVRGALAGKASPALVASLERMLEPDPDRRATSVGAALEGAPASLPPAAPIAAIAPVITEGDEAALVKSIRGLLFALWGLSWILVPVALKALNAPHALVPLIMFGSLGVLLVLNWHKAALLRWVVRTVLAGEGERGEKRARIATGTSVKVRVHARDLEPEEISGQTEVAAAGRAARAAPASRA